MAMSAAAGGYENRSALYRRLMRRNRVVGLLRLVVPAGGVLLALLFGVQIYIGGLARDFSVGGISIDRDNLVVATPRYNGVTADGGRYAVVADTARVAIADAELIELDAPRMSLMRSLGAAEMTAEAARARFHATRQHIDIPGLTHVADAAGMNGTLTDAEVDFVGQTLDSRGPVSITLASGLIVEGASLSYDGSAGTWAFERATVTLPGLPGRENRP